MEAVHDGHADVHEDAVKRGLSFRGSFFVDTDCFGAIVGRGIGNTDSLGESSKEFKVDWVVVYEEETFESVGWRNEGRI